jgi:hypothetical protein
LRREAEQFPSVPAAEQYHAANRPPLHPDEADYGKYVDFVAKHGLLGQQAIMKDKNPYEAAELIGGMHRAERLRMGWEPGLY